MSYNESIFIQTLGNYPLTRILNHLLVFREFDYSLSDIARESEVAWSTVNLLWPDLLKNEIVIHTRNVGRAKMYKLNDKDHVVKQLIKFANSLAMSRAPKKLTH